MNELEQKDRIEHRKNLRIKENFPVNWKISDKSLNGQGKVKNLSAAGFCLETNSPSLPANGSLFMFDAFLPDTQLADPVLGRMVWRKTRGLNNGKTLCGIEFVTPKDEFTSGVRERVQQHIIKSATFRKTLGVFSVILIIILAALCSYSVKETIAVYQELISSNQMLTDSSIHQAALNRHYQKELVVVRETLKETEMLLSQVQADNAQLQNQLALLTQEDSALKDRHEKITQEYNQVKERLAFYEREIKSIDEGKTMLKNYRSKIREVKYAMRGVKRQALAAKIAADKELDRIKSLRGNNGFLVKEGKSYHGQEDAAVKPPSQRSVEVKLEVVNQ